MALPESAIHVEKPLDFHLIFSRAAAAAAVMEVFLPALADSVVAAEVDPRLPALAESVVAAAEVEPRLPALADSVAAAVRMALTVQALAARASSLLNGESMNYELLNAQNEVINTIVLDDINDWPIPEGHTLRELPEPELITSQPLTQLAFLRRFTAPERIAIRASTDPIIQDFLQLVSLAQDILVTDPDTQMGVGYLVQQGFIAPERVAEILA